MRNWRNFKVDEIQLAAAKSCVRSSVADKSIKWRNRSNNFDQSRSRLSSSPTREEIPKFASLSFGWKMKEIPLYLLIAVHLLPAPVELFSASWTRFRDEIKIVKKKEKRKVKREISKKKVPWVTFQRSWTMFNLILPFLLLLALSLSISRWFLVAAWNCHFLRFVFCSSSMWSERQPLTSRLSHSLRPEHIFNLKILHTWDFTER